MDNLLNITDIYDNFFYGIYFYYYAQLKTRVFDILFEAAEGLIITISFHETIDY